MLEGDAHEKVIAVSLSVVPVPTDALSVATADDLRVVPNATMRALTGSVSDGAESAELFSGSDERGHSRDHLRRSMADWLHERLYNPSASPNA